MSEDHLVSVYDLNGSVVVEIDDSYESLRVHITHHEAYVFANDLVTCAQSVKYPNKNFPPIVREWRKERGYDD